MLIWPAAAILGLCALVCGALLLRSVGPAQRLGRLLAAAPEASIEDAIELAAGSPVYVRVSGRISSAEEFPDEHDRPLVFRRRRIEVSESNNGNNGSGGRRAWRTLLDEREAVPFGIEARGAFIAVDTGALGEGLVTIPREASGTMADLPPDLAGPAAERLAGDAPARLRIEQLSAVEHATVCGRPLLRDGGPALTAGLGRPLIVTTLELPAAMRLLAAGARLRVAFAAALILVGIGLLVIAGLGWTATALAAEPTPTPLPSPVLMDPLDPRAGEGASLVGAPLLAFAVIVGVGVLAAAATVLFVRLSTRR